MRGGGFEDIVVGVGLRVRVRVRVYLEECGVVGLRISSLVSGSGSLDSESDGVHALSGVHCWSWVLVDMFCADCCCC